MKAGFLPCSGKSIQNSHLTLILTAGWLRWLFPAIRTCNYILFLLQKEDRHQAKGKIKRGFAVVNTPIKLPSSNSQAKSINTFCKSPFIFINISKKSIHRNYSGKSSC